MVDDALTSRSSADGAVTHTIAVRCSGESFFIMNAAHKLFLVTISENISFYNRTQHRWNSKKIIRDYFLSLAFLLCSHKIHPLFKNELSLFFYSLSLLSFTVWSEPRGRHCPKGAASPLSLIRRIPRQLACSRSKIGSI